MTAITLRLDDSTYERLRTEAFEKRTTITALIREALAAPTTEAVKLDPEPWVITHNGVGDERTGIFKTRFENGFGESVVRLFRPRPAYSQSKDDYAAKLPEKGEN